MHNTFKIFIIGISIFSLLVVGAITYINYKSITILRSEVDALRVQSFPKTGDLINSRKSIDVRSSATTTPGLNQNIQPKESFKDMIPRINDFWGEIKEINGQTIAVEGHIADISKLDKFDESKGASFPMITKRFSVLADQETVFTKKLSELKTGDYVRIFSKKPIYGVDGFTATYVSYLTADDLSILR